MVRADQLVNTCCFMFSPGSALLACEIPGDEKVRALGWKNHNVQLLVRGLFFERVMINALLSSRTHSGSFFLLCCLIGVSCDPPVRLFLGLRAVVSQD